MKVTNRKNSLAFAGPLALIAFSFPALPQTVASVATPSITSAIVNYTVTPNTITITGQGFTTTETANLNGQLLQVVSRTATVIVANLPASLPAGSYQLEVTDTAKKASSVAFDVTIGAAGPIGPAGPVGPNTMAIALLRWYPANTAGTQFTTGPGPTGIAFDGSSVWVANQGGASVTKLRASDSKTLGTFNVGGGPFQLAFDGANIWLTNLSSQTVTKVQASDGTILGTFPVFDPSGIDFDGSNIWVATNAPEGNGVMKLRASDGTRLGTFTTGPNPSAVAFDGAKIWVANEGADQVTALRASDGTILGTFPVGHLRTGIAFDGTNIWVANRGSDTITKLRASDGANLGTFSTGSGPFAVAFDGANIWVTNQNGGVSKL